MHSVLQVANCSTRCYELDRRTLSWKSRTREQLKKDCWTAPWKFSEWIYRRLKIISRTRSRATQESSEELFSVCKQFWNIPTPLWFSRNPLRELYGQNIFTWTALCLQRIITEIRRGFNEHKRKLVLAKTRFVWTIRFSDQLLAGSLVEIWQLIRRDSKPQTTSIVSWPIREKTRIWFLNIRSDE